MSTRLQFEIPALDKIKSAEQARQIAIDYQNYASEASLSYGEIVYFTNRLEEIGKRFDLLDEFRENGVV